MYDKYDDDLWRSIEKTQREVEKELDAREEEDVPVWFGGKATKGRS